MNINSLLPAAATAMLCCWGSVARADEEADRAALRMIRTNYELAVNSGDLSKLKNDLSKDVTGVMVTGESVTGYDGLVSYWKGIQTLIGTGGSYQVTVNVDKTDLFGDLAVSRGTTDDTIRLPNGKELSFSAFWTAVCHKEDGVWKVFRVQAALNPVHNVFISLQLQRAELTYGAAGLAAGIVIVLLIQVLLRKRKHPPY